MNPKNELDRIAYYMLNIAAVAATGILSASGDATDSAGLFPGFIEAAFLCPFIMIWMIQMGIQVLGYIQYTNNTIESARALGKLNCWMYILEGVGITFYLMNEYKTGREGLLGIIISIICIGYILVPLVLLSINTHKKKK